jgi:D-threonate/D-erythronate kinase
LDCLLVSDDLTGANATGALLAKHGYSVMTALDPNYQPSGALDILSLVTYSRNLTMEEAYLCVREAVSSRRSDAVLMYAKRIDSTLRGNPGAETDAMLDALGEGYVAAVVSAFPKAGRVVKNSNVLVNGVMLMESSAALDVSSPVRSSSVLDIIRQQSRRKTAAVTCETYGQGALHLAGRIEALVREGNEILVFDAGSDEDISLIAGALILTHSKYVTVDPGPFTAIMYDKLRILQKKESSAKLLLVVGSICPEIRQQMEAFLRNRDAVTESISASCLLKEPKEREAEITRAANALCEKAGQGRLLCLLSGGLFTGEKALPPPDFSKNYGDCPPSAAIAEGFGQAAQKILQNCGDIHGVFLSGGDIAASVCKALHATGLQVKDEILPLAIYGRLAGGAMDGLHLITKGGMVGNGDAVLTCVDYLLGKMNEKE